MKTGEEKFDDEFRQKLRYSEVNPPAGLFDKIIPPKKNRRGFLWIWIASMIILFSTLFLHDWSHWGSNRITSENEHSLNTINSNNLNSPETDRNNPQNSLSDTKGLNEEFASQETAVAESKSSIDSKFQKSNLELSSISKSKKRMNNSEFKAETQFSSTISRDKSQSSLIYNSDLLFVPVVSLPYNGESKTIQQIKIHNPDRSESKEFKPSSLALEIYFGQKNFFTKISSETNDTMANRLLSEGENVFNSKNGNELGIKLLYDLKNNFTFLAGIHYSNNEDNFSFVFDEYYYAQHVDTFEYYILFPFTPPQHVTEYDTSIQLNSADHLIEHRFKFQTFSMSLGLAYNLPAGRFVISPEFGLIVDLHTKTEGSSNFSSDLETKTDDNFYKNGIRLNMNAGIQITYGLTEKVGLFVLSGYRFNLTELKTTPNFYSEKTNHLLMGGGIKYTLKKREAAKTTSGRSNK